MLQDACDRSWCNGVPKFLEFCADLVISPVEILSGESDDEALKLRIYLGSASATIGIVRPFVLSDSKLLTEQQDFQVFLLLRELSDFDPIEQGREQVHDDEPDHVASPSANGGYFILPVESAMFGHQMTCGWTF